MISLISNIIIHVSVGNHSIWFVYFPMAKGDYFGMGRSGDSPVKIKFLVDNDIFSLSGRPGT
jgi:hypothetical protein